MIKKKRERMIGDKTQIRMTVTPNMKVRRLTIFYKTKNYHKNPKLKNYHKNLKLNNYHNPTEYKVLRIKTIKFQNFLD